MSQASASILILTGLEVVWKFDHFIIFFLDFSSDSLFSALTPHLGVCPFKKTY